MAVQDLIITGHGRHAKVQVADVNLGNGTEATAVPGVLNVEGWTPIRVRPPGCPPAWCRTAA